MKKFAEKSIGLITLLVLCVLSFTVSSCSDDEEDYKYQDLVGKTYKYDWTGSDNKSYILSFKNDSVFTIYTQNNDDNTIFKDLIFEGSFSVEETTQRLSLSFDGVTHKWDGDKYFTVQYGYYDKESQELNVHLFYEYHSGKEKSFTRTFQRIKWNDLA